MECAGGEGNAEGNREPLLAAPSTHGGTTKRHVHSRLLALDLFRGAIMCIMAWDHITHAFTNANDLVHTPGAEMWEGPYATYDNAPRKFFARVVSHVCAPGFFVTMGMSFTFFTASRREKLGWTWGRVFQHHFVRGAVLLGIEYFKDLAGAFPKLVDVMNGREVIDWTGNEFKKGDEAKVIYKSILGVNEVMTSLAFTMMLSQLTLPVYFYLDKKWKGGAELFGIFLFILAFSLSNLAIVLAQHDVDVVKPPNKFPHFPSTVHNLWEVFGRILFYPGKFFVNWEALIDPVFPWIGVAWLGVGIGFNLRRNSEQAYRNMFFASIGLFVAFCFVRGFGGVMNYRGEQRGEESDVSALMRFFIQTKYPPDWAFASITLSVDFMLIYLFSFKIFASVEDYEQGVSSAVTDEESREEERDSATQNGWLDRVKDAFRNPLYPILVFGRTPLFFYVCHIWIINLSEAVFRLPDPPSGKFPFVPGVLIAWMFLLVVAYQLCVRYLRFKSSTDPESLWRLL